MKIKSVVFEDERVPLNAEEKGLALKESRDVYVTFDDNKYCVPTFFHVDFVSSQLEQNGKNPPFFWFKDFIIVNDLANETIIGTLKNFEERNLFSLAFEIFTPE